MGQWHARMTNGQQKGEEANSTDKNEWGITGLEPAT